LAGPVHSAWIGSIVAGGFLVGFGTAFAGGCTSGHAISGLANVELPSLIAVFGFFSAACRNLFHSAVPS